MNELALSLNLDNDLILKLDAFTKRHKKMISYLCKKCKTDFEVLSFCSDMMRLAVCLEFAQTYSLKFYEDKGIPEEVFYETMKDISIWCSNNSNKGLKNFRWIKNHLNCELFKIGRLQYQFSSCRIKSLDYSSVPLNHGDNVIYVHIPQGEKLIFSKCKESLISAKNFFATYYPEYNYQFFFSASWLLYGGNKNFMSEYSNIMQFQSLFKLIYSSDDDSQAIERIFGKRERNIERYAEKTSLQQNAKKYMLDGNKLGVGIGIIDKDSILTIE